MDRKTMNKPRHYSAGNIRDAAAYFIVGKTVAGGLAVAWLIVLLRNLSPPDYAAYVVLLAVFEITNALSGFGVPEAVQRFLPETRVRGNNREFTTLLLRALQIRILTTVLSGAVVLVTFDAIVRFAGLEPPHGLAAVFAAFFIAESLLRFFNDHLLGALLAQKTAQRNQIVKNSIRLAALLILLGLSHTLTLDTIFWLEFISAMSALIFTLPEAKQLKGAPQDATTPSEFLLDWRRITRVGVFGYLTICLYQLYGSDTLKLVVSRLLGATEAASYGMAAAIAEIIRRYLPLFLLHGVIRPSLVARYTENQSYEQQNHLCNLVFKLNLLILAPIIAFMAVSGDAFGAWISAGKYTSAGILLTVMTALIVSQAQRLVYAMLASVYTFPGTSLSATVASVVALPLSIFLGREYGAIGVLGGMFASDVIWITVVAVRLGIARRSYIPDRKGISKLIAAGIVGGGLAHLLVPHGEDLLGIVLAGFVVIGGYAGAAWIFKPFDSDDRLIIAKLIPKAFRFGSSDK